MEICTPIIHIMYLASMLSVSFKYAIYVSYKLKVTLLSILINQRLKLNILASKNTYNIFRNLQSYYLTAAQTFPSLTLQQKKKQQQN